MLEDSLLPFNFPAVERKKVTAAFDAGDGHYGRPEVMAVVRGQWCRLHLRPGGQRGCGSSGGAGGGPCACTSRPDPGIGRPPVLRDPLRRQVLALRARPVAARIEATTQGSDIRYVVTNIARGSAQWLYDSLYCARPG